MAKARPHLWTVEEFLAFEAREPERYEFVDGVVRMMTGGSFAHSVIKINVANGLNAALGDGPGLAVVDELKVVTETAIMYPDVVVTCTPVAPDDDRVQEPTAVVEVLSPTTERHDRIEKWREYQRIASLRHYVLIEQKERRIEIWSRTAAGWELEVVEPPADAVPLRDLGARLSLDEIYRNSGR
jgi:Uma2 family endonuclease